MRTLILLLLVCWMPIGCASSSGGRGGRDRGINHYYSHRYPMARDAVRAVAADRRSGDIVLDNMRLGMAALADGDLDESERALLRAYEYLTSGGVNAADRTISSTLLYEGIRVWKGEPYEQAMSFYYIAALFMLRGDWENARAAAANSLFALRDFGEKDMQRVVEDAVHAERAGRGDHFETGYRAVESQFTLGYLLAATCYVLMGQGEDGARMFDHVVDLRPDLEALALTLRENRYDTLLMVDLGRGPRKQAYGPDDSLVRYVPDGRRIATPKLSVALGGRTTQHAGAVPVVDLWTLSQNPRWWSLENMRKAKSTIGSVMVVGGLGAAVVGSQMRSPEVALAGLGAAAAGALLKGSSAADVRHLEHLPRCVYLVPLNLGSGRHDVALRFDSDGGSSATWHDLTAGSQGKPAVYYLRMHDGHGVGMPKWAAEPLYSVSVEQYKGGPPYVMGGTDMTPPSPQLMAAYHKAGVLADRTVEDLVELYRAEGIVFVPGPQGGDGKMAVDEQLYRHVADGGRVLFEPRPGTHAYQRITRLPHRRYEARSAELRRILGASQPPAGERSQP